LLASDTNCCQKTESLFAKAFKSLLQQNLPIADSRNCSTASRVEGSTKPDAGTPCNMEGNLGTGLDLIPSDESAAWMVVAGS
jgi:hypothetical protein